jgi:sugar phosphate isomerase/epimerase
MNTMKGPGIFLAQFLRDNEPYNNLKNIGTWVAGLGYKGVQIPTWDNRVIDLDKAAESKSYCEDLQASLDKLGLEVTELAAHLQGQVLAIHPAYETAFGAFYPSGLDDAGRIEWATAQLINSVKASANMGLKAVPVLSGGTCLAHDLSLAPASCRID